MLNRNLPIIFLVLLNGLAWNDGLSYKKVVRSKKEASSETGRVSSEPPGTTRRVDAPSTLKVVTGKSEAAESENKPNEEETNQKESEFPIENGGPPQNIPAPPGPDPYHFSSTLPPNSGGMGIGEGKDPFKENGNGYP